MRDRRIYHALLFVSFIVVSDVDKPYFDSVIVGALAGIGIFVVYFLDYVISNFCYFSFFSHPISLKVLELHSAGRAICLSSRFRAIFPTNFSIILVGFINGHKHCFILHRSVHFAGVGSFISGFFGGVFSGIVIVESLLVLEI